MKITNYRSGERPMKLEFGLLLLMLLGIFGHAAADQVVLKNGDRLTGAIVKSDGKTVVLKTDMVGEVTIAFENISGVTTDKPLYITLADGRTVNGSITTNNNQVEIHSSSGQLVVERSAIAVLRNDAEQRVYESTLNPGWLDQWTGGADLGLALTRGNSNTTNFALGLAMARETLRDKTTLYSASILNGEKTNGISHTTANTFRFGARYDRNINRKLFGYGFTDLEHNG